MGQSPAAEKSLVRRRGWLGWPEPGGHVRWLPAWGVQWAQVCESLTCQTCQAGGRRPLAAHKEKLDCVRPGRAGQGWAGLGAPGSCQDEKGGGA